MTQQCKSCGGFCGKAGCERANLDAEMNKQREAFEAWATTHGANLDRSPFGGYRSLWTEGAWSAWQAAQTAQPAQVPEGWQLALEALKRYSGTMNGLGYETDPTQEFGNAAIAALEAALAAPSTKEQSNG